MKRRDMLIGGVVGLAAAQASAQPSNGKCAFPECVKEGRIDDDELLILWKHEGKLRQVHAFHAFEKYMPPLKKR
jgi:hypothetical protein